MAPAEVPGTWPVAAAFWQSPAESVAWGSVGNQTAGVPWTDPVPLHGTAWLNRDINFYKSFFLQKSQAQGFVLGWTCSKVFFIPVVIPAISVTG